MEYWITGAGIYRELSDGTPVSEGSVRITKEEYEAGVNTPEEAAIRLESALDAHLDSVAQSYRYESIGTMVTYATSDHPTFGAEGRAAIKWRDACYAYGIQVISDVQDGKRGIPTEAELIAELPTFESFLGN